MPNITVPAIHFTQRDSEFYVTRLDADAVCKMSYAAVRGESNEEGAVQRILSLRRIGKIKEYTRKIGLYPSCIILNWIDETDRPTFTNSMLTLSTESQSAQIIDGQHRIAGIREAIKDEPSLAHLQLPVALYMLMNTQKCADIFLSINTEQKPVPRSLVFDLYGLASSYIADPGSVRAKDIAQVLHEDMESPYFDCIKFPGAPRRRGGIALSTVVTALKPLVEPNGVFEQVPIRNLADQAKATQNFFLALASLNESHWQSRDNAFMYAAGFAGAVDFFRQRIIDYCRGKRSFEVETIRKAIALNDSNRILQSTLKGLGGAQARKRVFDHLDQLFEPGGDAEANLKF